MAVLGLELLVLLPGALGRLAGESSQTEPHQGLEAATQEMVTRTKVRDRLCWDYWGNHLKSKGPIHSLVGDDQVERFGAPDHPETLSRQIWGCPYQG